MISLSGAVMLSFALAVSLVLYGVMRPLYTPGSMRAFAFKPNFDFKGTRARNLAERKRRVAVGLPARPGHLQE